MSKKNVKYPEIKKSLCDREHVSRTVLRGAIRDAAGMDRWQAWVEKRDYGDETRLLLLAYAMLRGKPYIACEPKCGEFNMPSASGICNVAMAHGFKLELANVKAWLASEPAPAAVVQEAPKSEPVPVVAPAVAVSKPGLLARLFGKTA
jgi:hypothetical protein